MAEISVNEEQNRVTTVETSNGVGNIAFTLGTGDASLFSITDAGVLTFKKAPNFEAMPQKITYTFVVTVTDSAMPSAFTDTQTINITLNDVEEITIPDANFEQALIDLGHDRDGPVNQSISLIGAQEITRLDVSDPESNDDLPNVSGKITDLTGIGAMTGLTDLSASGNALTRLDVSHLTGLTSLQVRDNQLTFLNVKNENNILLTSLDVVGNPSICVQVDDEDYRPATSWVFSVGTTFSEDCKALSIDKNQLKESVSIYLSPVSNILRIQISNQIQLKKIQIYNVIGKLLKEERINNTVQISDLSSGIFFVKIETDIGMLNKKIVKFN